MCCFSAGGSDFTIHLLFKLHTKAQKCVMFVCGCEKLWNWPQNIYFFIISEVTLFLTLHFMRRCCNCFQVHISNHLFSLWSWLGSAELKWVCVCVVLYEHSLPASLAAVTPGTILSHWETFWTSWTENCDPCGFMLCNKWWNMISWIHYMIMAGWFVSSKIEMGKVGNRWRQHPLHVDLRLFRGKKTELYEVQWLCSSVFFFHIF